MNSIEGNITAQFQVKKESGKNKMGERTFEWITLKELHGFLDLMSGDSRYTNYNAKIQESTHIFICDYADLDRKVQGKRILINDTSYDVKLIDDPMELHEHLEIYLQLVG